MELTYRLIDTPERFESFRTLLRASGLPADDLDYTRDLLVGYYEGDHLVGTGALEVYDTYALLRSLSVKLGIRGQAVGTNITEYLLAEARKRKLTGIYLLTERARDFFLKKGFAEAAREAVPDAIKASSEFSHVCGASAVVMHLPL